MNEINNPSEICDTTITSHGNSAHLCLATEVANDRIVVREAWRDVPSHDCNYSGYSLECWINWDGSAALRFRGITIIGRKLTPDGWVPQLATTKRTYSRTHGEDLFKSFYRFVKSCVMDENYSDIDVFPTYDECVKHSSVLVDLNLLASHAVDAPTWWHEDPRVVIAHLASVHAHGAVRDVLNTIARGFWDMTWQLD